jgi:tetratricopeptide (TPR) repeat protein
MIRSNLHVIEEVFPMIEESTLTKFKDSPGSKQLLLTIQNWRKPEISKRQINRALIQEQATFQELSSIFRAKLTSVKSLRSRKRLQKSLIDWLYDFMRLNIKRGRVFDLHEVLRTGQADCLGYAKIFTILSRYCGLDSGIVEVIIDNCGRNIPHTISLVILPDNSLQFIDFWYGSKDIRHQRLGLRVKHTTEWHIEDIDYKNLKRAKEVTYLPDYCVDAITLYIEGNRSLKNKDYSQAVKRYSESIRLYPQNARSFYNRAIAYENLGELKKAEEDYARALQDDDSLSRTLATQPEDIVDLIRLDEENISETDQMIFLLRRGFVTGRSEPPSKIARKMRLSVEEVGNTLQRILVKGV